MTVLALRPLVADDCWRLHAWRCSERIRSVSVDDRPIAEEVHARWFERVMAERAGELRVVEWQGRPVGLVQLEHVDRGQATSAWGCYLGDTDVHPGVGAALPLLGLGLGFGTFGLRRMTAHVLDINTNMRSMHRRLRIPAEGVLRRHARRSDGSEVDVHAYGVHREEWPQLRDGALRLLPSRIRGEVARLTVED